MVNCDLVGFLCTQVRVDQAFFRKAGGQAGNDVTFSNYVTFSLNVRRHVNMLPCEQAI